MDIDTGIRCWAGEGQKLHSGWSFAAQKYGGHCITGLSCPMLSSSSWAMLWMSLSIRAPPDDLLFLPALYGSTLPYPYGIVLIFPFMLDSATNVSSSASLWSETLFCLKRERSFRFVCARIENDQGVQCVPAQCGTGLIFIFHYLILSRALVV